MDSDSRSVQMLSRDGRSYAGIVAGNNLQSTGVIQCLGLQFIRYRIRGDGNCYFRSVAAWIYGNEEQHGRVRRELMEYARYRWAELSGMCKMCYPQCDTVNAYVAYMGKSCTYAGQFELVATSKLYNRIICTYNKNSRSFIIERPRNAGNEPILLYYDFEGQHYEVLSVVGFTTRYL